MKKLIAAAALTLVFGSAVAQDKGPAPQTGMEQPGKTKGAKENGAMDTKGTTGMNTRNRGPNGSPESPPKAMTGPNNMPSTNEQTPK